MANYDVDVELAAVQFVVWTLIATHPNKQKLLSTFDRLSSEYTVAAIATSPTGGMPNALRVALNKYRAHIEEEAR